MRYLPAIAATLLAPYSLMGADEDASDFVFAPEQVEAFFEANCYSCHDTDVKKAELDLFDLSYDFSDPHTVEKWELIYHRVKADEMPPKKKARPETAAKVAFLSELYPKIRKEADERVARNGRTMTRKLTRSEYENTLHDLFRIFHPLQKSLPPSVGRSLFENNSYEQGISHLDLEKYLETADVALDAAWELALNPRPAKREVFSAKDLVNWKKDKLSPKMHEGAATIWHTQGEFIGRLYQTRVWKPTQMTVTIKGKSINLDDRPLWVSVRRGQLYTGQPLLTPVTTLEFSPEESAVTFDAFVDYAERLEIRPLDKTTKQGSWYGLTRSGIEEEKAPGLAISEMIIETPDYTEDSAYLRALLFGDALEATQEGKRTVYKPVVANPAEYAEELIHRMAQNLFRRPVEREALEPYFLIMRESLVDSDGDFLAALRSGYRALLVSPQFLFLQESRGPLDRYALASRLSYFLWDTSPDEQLLEWASAEERVDRDSLASQIDRMMQDERFSRFTNRFTGEWLDVNEIDATSPDIYKYALFDPILQDSFVEETRQFVSYLFQQNLPVENLVDSDWTFLNERLARHYDVPFESEKGAFQKVTLPTDSPRGGVITQGSVLKVTADGTHTSPVLRGVWMLERILGEHVPPPSVAVPAVEPDTRGATTIREELQKHRSSEECASCHTKIDPVGFALESFDPIGAWRDHYKILKGRATVKPGPPVDPGYQTPSGETFADIRGLKSFLVKEEEKIAKNLAQKLLGYATGAETGFADESAINRIVTRARDKCEGEKFRARDILVEVVLSREFLSK